MTTAPSDGTPEMGMPPDTVERQPRIAPSDQTRIYVSQPVRQSRPVSSAPVSWPTRSNSAPDLQPAEVPNQDSGNDHPMRNRRRDDGSGGG